MPLFLGFAGTIVLLVGAAVAGWLLAGENSSSREPEAALCSAHRTTADQPDDVPGPQVHALYVLPSDGADRALDTNGVLLTSFGALNSWLAKQTATRGLRVDTCGGRADITFVRLGRTDADIRSAGLYVRNEIERELHAAGFNARNKIYAAYYDGSSSYACGGGAWPPRLIGNVAALYLRGEPPGASPCSSNAFATSAGSPGYIEFAMLHEILHTLGLVAVCAPNHTREGHVADDPRDLMYAGERPWRPSILDKGRDDYFGHANAECADLKRSEFLH
jgi:hypothetical protein